MLYKNGYIHGHYVLYKDQKNQLYSGGVKTYGSSNEGKISLGAITTGNTPFVTIIINDEDLLQKAKKVQITFTDGTVESAEIYGKGTIVLYHNEKNREQLLDIKLIIYDKNMKKLYEN